MFSLLLHKDVFLPDEFKHSVIRLQAKMKSYYLSRHLQEHLDNQDNENRSHRYFRNFVVNTLNEMCSNSRRLVSPFEVEVSKDFHFFGKPGWFVTKFCIRLPYKINEDLVIVVRPRWDKNAKDYDYNNFMITTAWLNSKDDSHKTLDANKYADLAEWAFANVK